MSYENILKKEFGPILYALGDSSGAPHYRVLFYGQNEPRFTSNGIPIKAVLLKPMPQGCFWVFEFFVEQRQEAIEHIYTVNMQPYTFIAPGKNTEKLRIAYASCNGSEEETPLKTPSPDRNILWENIKETHKERAYHLLIQGGDQIYADSVWKDIPFLSQWISLPRSKQYKIELPDNVYQEIRDYYFSCYMSYWSQPHIKDILATIPSLMIWDDHDIFDGWGSWSEHYQSSPVYQAIFKAAKEAFYIFQRGQQESETITTASMLITLGHTAFIAPDLRSERSRIQVMGEIGWSWLKNTLDNIGHHKKNLVIISSVPLATSHFAVLDPLLTGFPSFIARLLPKKINPKQFADDIHDQWRVPAHRNEWLRILNTFLDFSDHTGTRVIALSGEIHLGARSTIKRNGSVIHQFIASGIAHKPASKWVVLFCELLSKGTQNISDEINIRMEYFFRRGKKRYLRARNWLSLELHSSKTISACWYAENEPSISFED